MVGQDSCVVLQNGMKSILNVNLCKYARKRRREKRRKKKIKKKKKTVRVWSSSGLQGLYIV